MFEVDNLLTCAASLRALGSDAQSMEEVAAAVVGQLRASFTDETAGSSVLPLVRFYVTQPVGSLEPDLQDVARATGTDVFPERNVMCLALLASAGEESTWNDRRQSLAHRAIPLPSIEAVHRLPMIARLIDQLGLDAGLVVDPDLVVVPACGPRGVRVFYVSEARDSPYVPAQNDFVIPYGIRSVVGCGGTLPNGSIFAVVLFSTTPIPATALDAFVMMGLAVEVSVLPHTFGRVFADAPLPERTEEERHALDALVGRAATTTLDLLVEVTTSVARDNAARLARARSDAQQTAAELAALRVALAASDAQKVSLLDGALDAAITMDSLGRITEFNRAAEATFGHVRADVIGRSLADVVIPATMRARHREGLARAVETGDGPILGRRIEIRALHADGSEFPVELTVTRLAETEPPVFTGFVRDVTPAHEAAEQLIRGRERLAHIARTLQTSLLPPVLPDIAGVELAAGFRPLGDGYEVGGDFYDVFEVGEGQWALTLGDVCGKGSEAAVITALARYTLRAAAMRSADPATVLATLNEAVNRQHPDQFCTVAYSVFDPRSGVFRLALGGHPHPLILTAAGEVIAVGKAGTLLGPYAGWTGQTDIHQLESGDTLVFYTDGVTEARAGKEFFGDERVAGILRSAQGASAVNLVQLIEAAVVDYAGALTDDLALLAIRKTA